MNIFNGREKATALDAKILEYLSDGPVAGELAIILIGDNEASEKYISIKKKYCDSRGIKCGIYRIDDRLKDEDIFKSREEFRGHAQLGRVEPDTVTIL